MTTAADVVFGMVFACGAPRPEAAHVRTGILRVESRPVGASSNCGETLARADATL